MSLPMSAPENPCPLRSCESFQCLGRQPGLARPLARKGLVLANARPRYVHNQLRMVGRLAAEFVSARGVSQGPQAAHSPAMPCLLCLPCCACPAEFVNARGFSQDRPDRWRVAVNEEPGNDAVIWWSYVLGEFYTPMQFIVSWQDGGGESCGLGRQFTPSP